MRLRLALPFRATYGRGMCFLWAAWDDKKQTWHDKMISSIVVKTDG